MTAKTPARFRDRLRRLDRRRADRRRLGCAALIGAAPAWPSPAQKSDWAESSMPGQGCLCLSFPSRSSGRHPCRPRRPPLPSFSRTGDPGTPSLPSPLAESPRPPTAHSRHCRSGKTVAFRVLIIDGQTIFRSNGRGDLHSTGQLHILVHLRGPTTLQDAELARKVARQLGLAQPENPDRAASFPRWETVRRYPDSTPTPHAPGLVPSGRRRPAPH